jgi:hypothetical protein
MTASRIEPATFRLVVKCLKHVGRCVNRNETSPVPQGAVRKEGVSGIEAKTYLMLEVRVMEEKYLV